MKSRTAKIIGDRFLEKVIVIFFEVEINIINYVVSKRRRRQDPIVKEAVRRRVYFEKYFIVISE